MHLRKVQVIIGSMIFIVVVLFALITIFSVAPSSFPQHKVISIPKNTYLSQAAKILAEENVIRSEMLFKAYALFTSGHRQVQAGDYLFDAPQSALRVAYRMTHGEQDLPQISITLYEGMTAREMVTQIKKNIPSFDDKTFYDIAKSYEGYLFPDTYFFYENVTPAQVLTTLRDNFNQKIKTALLDIQAFGKPLNEVIEMASIVEREATSTADRKVIAGVLWKRIDIGMALQVDPPFYYILGKGSLQLTVKDMAMNSPYNLYTHKGLPPTPISNPGLDAILATVNPKKSDFLFFLADKRGVIHYAETNDGHVANKSKYLP
ncbi:MAG: endolytic transglycosylase MltG [Candidatus Taylorbacteria bacterium]